HVGPSRHRPVCDSGILELGSVPPWVSRSPLQWGNWLSAHAPDGRDVAAQVRAGPRRDAPQQGPDHRSALQPGWGHRPGAAPDLAAETVSVHPRARLGAGDPAVARLLRADG